MEEFRPEPREEALAALVEESRLDPDDGDERHPDAGNAERFAGFFAEPTATMRPSGCTSTENASSSKPSKSVVTWPPLPKLASGEPSVL